MDLGINEPVNVSGMGFLIDTNDTKQDFDPSELEKEISRGVRPKAEGKSRIVEDFNKTIDSIGRNSGYQYVKPTALQVFDPLAGAAGAPAAGAKDPLDELLGTDDIFGLDNNTPSGGDDLDQLLKSIDTPTPATMAAATRNSANSGAPSILDTQLSRMTNEEKRQRIINGALGDIMPKDGSTAFNIEQERVEDDKARKLEHISSLLEILNELSESTAGIPRVTAQNSMEEIDAVLRHLTLKNDRKRCCSFAEECILLGAHGVEWLFDGEKSYLGYKPDMVDWHKTVQSKLRRMRHDTSTVVNNIMQEYGLGSGMRLALELIPSAFLYSRMRKSSGKDNLVSDDEFNAGVSKMRDAEASRTNKQ